MEVLFLKLQKIKRLFAFTLAVSMVTPTVAYADSGVTENKGVVDSESTDGGNEDVPEVSPDEPEVNPDVPGVNPDEPEVKPDVPEVNPDVPDKPTEPEVEPETPDKPTEPEVNPDVPDKPTEPEVEPENPSEPEVKPETPDKPTEQDKPEQKPEENKPSEQSQQDSNTSNVVRPPVNTVIKMPDVTVQKDFRFWNIAKDYGFAKEDIKIIEDMKDDARVIGTLPKDGMLFVVKSEDNGWLYVESGTVRGFVREDKVSHGDEATAIITNLKKQVEEKTAKENEEIRKKIESEVSKDVSEQSKDKEGVSSKEDIDKKVEERYQKEKKEVPSFETLCKQATQVVDWHNNKALTHTRTTTQNVLINKDYGLVDATALNVREGKGTDTRIVGLLPSNALVYIIADKGAEWIYVESGDVRGFVHRDYLKYGDEVNAEVARVGEDNFPKVQEIVGYEDNKATHYTMTSVKSGYHSTAKREEVVKYASQFIGNPYVWGGTDPVNGADCSGFVQSVYKAFGYDLPRVSQEQAYYGEKIDVKDALPGDLIFYQDESGDIYHVAMYAGEGVTVEAMNSERGITNGKVQGDACWATRILKEDTITHNGEEVVRIAEDGSYGKYLGNFKLTYYCACTECCGEYANGITATGTKATQGRTIAVDPSVIPYGSEVIIGNRVYIAEDCGGAIKGNRIDIYMDSHEDALSQGLGYADVYLKK